VTRVERSCVVGLALLAASAFACVAVAYGLVRLVRVIA